jgi:hypothetical protein
MIKLQFPPIKVETCLAGLELPGPAATAKMQKHASPPHVEVRCLTFMLFLNKITVFF